MTEQQAQKILEANKQLTARVEELESILKLLVIQCREVLEVDNDR